MEGGQITTFLRATVETSKGVGGMTLRSRLGLNYLVDNVTDVTNDYGYVYVKER